MKGRKFAVPLALLLASLIVIPGASACDVDVKPGSWPNSINVCNNGVLPVAYACSYNGYTAEYLKDHTYTVKVEIQVGKSDCWNNEFCGDFPREYLKLNVEDVTSCASKVTDRGDPDYCPDGCPDLTMKFRTQDIFDDINPADYESDKTIKFEMWGYDRKGQELFHSFDYIRFVPANCKEKPANCKKSK